MITHAPPGSIDTHSRAPTHGHRDAASVRGVTLHQTAALLGPDPRRWDDVPAHFGVAYPAGEIMVLADWNSRVYHGNALNDTIGIEIACRAAGVEGRVDTVWVPRSRLAEGVEPAEWAREVTDPQILAVRDLLRWLADLGASLGADWRRLYAHRQSARKKGVKRADPGSRIWSHVAVPLIATGWAEGETRGGLDLPDAWTLDARGVRY